MEIARQKKPALFPCEHESITIHRLRHTYATQKLRDGIPLPSVRKLRGHKNIQTTLRHAETDLETIKQELDDWFDLDMNARLPVELAMVA